MAIEEILLSTDRTDDIIASPRVPYLSKVQKITGGILAKGGLPRTASSKGYTEVDKVAHTTLYVWFKPGCLVDVRTVYVRVSWLQDSVGRFVKKPCQTWAFILQSVGNQFTSGGGAAVYMAC